MKTVGKKFTLVLLIVLCFSFFVNAQSRKKANRDTEQWRYEVECVGVGVKGTYLIKVWSYSKKQKVAIEQAKKNAVHGVIFKGYAGGEQGCTPQKALVVDAYTEQKNKEFFTNFFADGGRYMRYVSFSADGSIAAGDRLKISRKEYKIGVVVSVRKDDLRKELEREGVIKGLSDGF